MACPWVVSDVAENNDGVTDILFICYDVLHLRFDV